MHNSHPSFIVGVLGLRPNGLGSMLAKGGQVGILEGVFLRVELRSFMTKRGQLAKVHSLEEKHVFSTSLCD
jgi:hypothetical protein